MLASLFDISDYFKTDRLFMKIPLPYVSYPILSYFFILEMIPKVVIIFKSKLNLLQALILSYRVSVFIIMQCLIDGANKVSVFISL